LQKDIPAQYIYEPWTAPLSVQKQANCIIGACVSGDGFYWQLACIWRITHSSLSETNLHFCYQQHCSDDVAGALGRHCTYNRAVSTA
jgi:hypothetical protein